MKKVIFVFALMLGISTVYAQQENVKASQNTQKKNLTLEEIADKVTAKLKTELSLTDEQVPKVKALTLDRLNKVSIVKASSTDPNVINPERKKAFDSWESGLKDILTTDQYATYETKKAEKIKKIQDKKAEKTKSGSNKNPFHESAYGMWEGNENDAE